MLAIVVLAATFLAPFAARRSSTLKLNAPDAQQLATPEAAQAASFEESQVLGA